MEAVDVLVSAENGDFTIGQRQYESQTEQFDVFLEPCLGSDIETNNVVGVKLEANMHVRH